MPLAACPSAADLERLFLGGLPEDAVEAVEQHVLGCTSCLEKLKKQLRAKDTFAGARIDDTQNDAVASGPAVDGLIRKLEAMRTVSAKSPRRGAAMIAFSCS